MTHLGPTNCIGWVGGSVEGELGKVNNFGEQLFPEFREFGGKISVPLQGLGLDDLREFDLVLDADWR